MTDDTVTDPTYLRREAVAALAAVARIEDKVEKAQRDLDAVRSELDAARAQADRARRDADEADANQPPRVDGDIYGDSVDAHAIAATGNTED